MACANEKVKVQIDATYYKEFSTPRISYDNAPEGNKASFDITLQSGEPPITEEKIVHITLNGESMFSGLVESAPIELNGEQVIFRVSCVGFGARFARKEKTASFDTVTSQAIDINVGQLIKATGAGFDPDLGVNLLDYLILDPPSSPAPGTGQVDIKLTRIISDNETLEEVLFRYYPEYTISYIKAGWNDITEIGTAGFPVVAILVMTHKDYLTGVPPLAEINADTHPNCNDPRVQWRGLKLNIQSSLVTRIMTAKTEEILRDAIRAKKLGTIPATELPITNYQTILADENRNRFKLRNQTTRVKKIRINTP